MPDKSPKLVAFYLPQFHPIPENDEWWGEGFTEWTNVKRARQLAPGQNQPRIPEGDSYYDLNDAEVMERQAALAKRFGVDAFCFYYYHFRKDKQLLDMPLKRLLDSGKPDMPFCLCWANENWTRAWDGGENEILIKQEYGDEDLENFARGLIPYFQDPRYLRIDGKPLLVVYHTRSIPNTQQVVSHLRRIWLEEGGLEVHLCGALTFGEKNPLDLDVDSAVDFPPHNIESIQVNPEKVGLPEDHPGLVCDYQAYVKQQITKPRPDFPHFPGVMTCWDNTPRRGERGTFFINGGPIVYQRWLANAIESSREAFQDTEPLVFINAWNEWAEGAYLEPDTVHGHTYLEATKLAKEGKTILSAVHDKVARGDALSEPEMNILRASDKLFSDQFEAVDMLKSEFERLTENESRQRLKRELLQVKVREERAKKEKLREKLDDEKAKRIATERSIAVKAVKPLLNLERSLRKRVGSKPQKAGGQAVRETPAPREPKRSAAKSRSKKLSSGNDSPAASGNGNLDYQAKNLIRFGDTYVRLAEGGDLYDLESTKDCFVLGKPTSMLNRLCQCLDETSAKRIVDIGIFKGGSIVFLNEYCQPDLLIGIERNPVRNEPLDEYLSSKSEGNVIVNYGIDQSDLASLEIIFQECLGKEKLDIVIDDASHFNHETRESFRYLFPLLREGGIYIIEDWGWAHWPEDYWQKEKGGSYFEKKEPLSNLILELVILSASAPDLVENVWIDRGQVIVKRGKAEVDQPMPMDKLILNRGIPLPLIPATTNQESTQSNASSQLSGGAGSDSAPASDEPIYDFDADCLRVWGKSVSFLNNPDFQRAYARGIDGDDKLEVDPHLEWRAHVCIWAAKHALHLPGDFVECGVWTGRLSLAVCDYVDFNKTGKTFHLFDTFCGGPDEQLTDEERQEWREKYDESFWDCYEVAKRNFAPYPKANLIRGKVPDTLESVDISKVSYLSLDMNAMVPELAALEYFWPRLSPGAPVILDDYGWSVFLPQRRALDAFAEKQGVKILDLPTGQGLLIRP